MRWGAGPSHCCTMTIRTGTALAGVALLLAGLVLGLIPHTAADGSCGSAFRPSGAARISDLVGDTRGAQAACDDLLSGDRQVALVLTGLGAAALLVAAVARPTT